MSDTAAQTTLREWRRHIAQPACVAALFGASVVMGLAGPFGTDAALPLLPRLAYWFVMVVATYSVGALCGIALNERPQGWPHWARVLLQGLLTAISACLVVLVLNALTLGWVPAIGELPGFLAPIWVIAMIISAVIAMVRRSLPTPGTAPAPPVILERMPLEKRGPLVALSVEDHYVRIRTTKGEAMVLMRISDAIRETGDLHGGQVHRSHWVAFGQVKAAQRLGDRAILTMSVGDDIPVSRANMPLIREAGLLPR